MPLKNPAARCRPGPQVPEPDGPVIAGRGQRRAVGAESDAEDRPGVALENSRRLIGLDDRPRAQVPEPDCSVLAGRGQRSAIAGKRNPRDPALVPAEHAQVFSGRQVPDPNLPAGFRTGHSRSRPVEGQAVDRAVMAGNSPDNLIRGGFPEQESRRFGGAGDLAAVRFERDAAEGPIVSPQRLQLGMEAPAEMVPLPAAQADRAAIEELVGEHGVIVLPVLLGGNQLLEVRVVLHVHELGLCLDPFPGLMIEGQASLGDVGSEASRRQHGRGSPGRWPARRNRQGR